MIGTGRQPAGYMLHQRYRLLHIIGQGGMGAVYVAQDTQLGDRQVAVKEMSMSLLTPQAVEQFRREAHLLASLHHPNLPVIHEYFCESNRWYLVMSFIEGQNLQAALDVAPGNRLPVNDVVQIGIELCEVLAYLHTHEPQVIFRDLKPQNIMLTPKGHICLIDFGIARHFKQEQTKDTAYYYSMGYAPPEQYGQSQTSPRSDIYSLGATLHQMLSGHNPSLKPFQFSPLQLVDPSLPMLLVKLITQMLEMNEQARPASVAEVREQLEKILAPGRIAGTRKASSEQQEYIKARQKGSRVQNRVVGGIAAFLCNALTAYFIVWHCPSIDIIDIQLMYLFILSEFFAAILISARSVFVLALINSAIILAIFYFSPKTAYTVYMIHMHGYSIIGGPIIAQVVVAIFVYFLTSRLSFLTKR